MPQAAFDQLVAQGFRPRFVDGTAVGDQILYSAVFEKRNGSPWVARHGLTARQYQGAFEELVGQGFRPVWVSGAAIGSDVFYAAVFDKRPGPAFVARHGLDERPSTRRPSIRCSRQGFRPTVVSTAGPVASSRTLPSGKSASARSALAETGPVAPGGRTTRPALPGFGATQLGAEPAATF